MEPIDQSELLQEILQNVNLSLIFRRRSTSAAKSTNKPKPSTNKAFQTPTPQTTECKESSSPCAASPKAP